MPIIAQKLTAETILPSDRAILAHQGIPPDTEVNQRTAQLLEEARQLFLALAQPQSVICAISIEQFTDVYLGEGVNDPDDPLARVYPASSRMILFAATVGAELSDKISDLMESNELAEGSLLDSIASEAADKTAEVLQNEWAKTVLAGERSRTEGVMRYSPGYCGWHISGQKKLFGFLKPDRIGIRLNERFLMSPLKSVSGVIVVAPKNTFDHDIGYGFCSDCRDRSCITRIDEMKKRTFA